MIQNGERLSKYHLKHATANEYFSFADDGFHYELIDRVMMMSPSVNFEHNDIEATMLAKLCHYLDHHHQGKVVSDQNIRFNHETVYRPDIS